MTHEQLLATLEYRPEEGRFYSRKNGREVSHLSSGGRYASVGVLGEVHKRSRLAWFYTHGAWPKNQIDHINGDRFDDSISNLRDVTQRTNNQNMPVHRSGHLVGTSRDKVRGRWFSRIKINGRAKRLGYFDTQQEAHEAYKKALNEL